MIQEATYTNDGRTARISVEKIDTWIESSESILNFPNLVLLDGDRMHLTVRRAQHATLDIEPKYSVLSEDAGATWQETRGDMEFGGGGIGYMSDGTIVRMEHNTVEAERRNWDKRDGPFHLVMQEDDPTFRFRRWKRTGEYIETREFKVTGLPWGTASYQSYASVLELTNGDLITALEAQVGPPDILDEVSPSGRRRHRISMSVFIVRSQDGGRNWQFVTAFRQKEIQPVYGVQDRPVDEGFTEADLVVAADERIVCVMRTGSYSPMWQSVSDDGGSTWGRPAPTGWPGVKPRLQYLPGGVLACASGRGAYGHPQVTHVMLSLDGAGEHWEYPFAFHTGPGCSYSQTMQRDGRLHVIYSHSDFTRPMGTHDLPVQAIKRAVLSVEML